MALGDIRVEVPQELIQHSTTPSVPDANFVSIYAKNDGNLYQLTPAGVETKLSGGGSSSRTFAFFGG